MASVNKVIVMGNLGRDPETRYSPDGGAITNIAVATSRQWKDKATGERKEETEWHRIVFFGRQAEIAGEYLKKGRPVYVEGRLKTRKWQDKEGVERYTTEIVAEELQLLGGREGGAGGGGAESEGSFSRDNAPARSESGVAAGASGGAGGGGGGARGAPSKKPASNFDDMDDDIPF